MSCKIFVVETQCGPSTKRNLRGSCAYGHIWAPCFWAYEHAWTCQLLLKIANMYIYMCTWVHRGTMTLHPSMGFPRKSTTTRNAVYCCYSELLEMRWRCLFWWGGVNFFLYVLVTFALCRGMHIPFWYVRQACSYRFVCIWTTYNDLTAMSITTSQRCHNRWWSFSGNTLACELRFSRHVICVTYTHIYIYITHIYIYTYKHTYIHTWIYIYIHAYIFTYIYIHTYIRVFMNIHIYLYLHIYIYIHIYIYTYAHTYAYAYAVCICRENQNMCNYVIMCVNREIYICIYIMICGMYIYGTYMHIYMHIYIYAYMYIHMYVYVYIHVYVYVYVYLCICKCKCICKWICIHIHVYIYVYIYICTYICKYVYMYMFICICICKYIYVYVYVNVYVYMYICIYM